MKLHINDSNDIIINLDDGQEQHLTLSKLAPYWSYTTPEDIEYTWVDAQQKFVVGIITVASGQGGILFVWDTEEQRIVHISDGSYAVRALLHHKQIYTIRYVYCWGTPAHLTAEVVDFGSLDSQIEGNELKLNLELSDENNPYDDPSLRLEVINDTVYASYGTKRVKLGLQC